MAGDTQPRDGRLGVVVADWAPPRVPGPLRLSGRYVELEPLAPVHAAALHSANRADDAIWDFLPYGPFADQAKYAAWVDAVAGRPDPQFFVLTDRTTAAPGGVASLMRVAPEAGSIEVGHICLSPSLQRTRAGSEAIFLLAQWAFEAGYRRFEWKCNALNLASRRSAERFGFSFEGVFRQAAVIKGRNRDTAWFAMTDGDWRCLKPAWKRWLDPENFDAAGKQREALGHLTAPCLAARDPLLDAGGGGSATAGRTPPGAPMQPAPEVMDFLMTRRSRSARTIGPPAPDRAETLRLLTAAARVPDHGKLEPWRFVVLRGAGLARFAAAIRARAAAAGQDADKGALAFEQAPLAIAVVGVPRPSEKIPPIEQTLSAGAVALSLLNAALASGWGASWLTGWAAYDRPLVESALGLAPLEWVAGFVHVGTAGAAPPDRPRPDVAALTTWAEA